MYYVNNPRTGEVLEVCEQDYRLSLKIDRMMAAIERDLMKQSAVLRELDAYLLAGRLQHCLTAAAPAATVAALSAARPSSPQPQARTQPEVNKKDGTTAAGSNL